jgi:hypothetical protein
VNHKMDNAIAIFRSLAGSTNPEMSMRSSQALSQALTFKERTEKYQVRLENRTGPEAPAPEPADREQAQEATTPEHVLAAPIHFVKGKLVSVDCSATPQALLTVAVGAKSVKLHIHNSAHVAVLGADTFSCAWKEKNVAVNYRDRPDGDGDVVSVEIQ